MSLADKAGDPDQRHLLAPEYAPLKDIRERPRVVRDLGSKTAITTIGTHAYVRQLDEWLGRVPPGSAKYRAILRHEQEHSKRQLDYGLWSWLTRYGIDTKFALLEEQIGYYYEITERRRLGGQVIPEAYASILSKYAVLTGKLISYEDALQWVRDVLSGQWTPPN